MFGFSMGANFFMQIAKLRAIRPIWAQIVKAFGGNEESQKIHIHGRPAKFFKTVYDPYVNLLRDTTQLFSGVVGGVDSFENSTFDEPVRKGDEFSRRIARNMQIILQEEFGLLQPIDPAGGSWAVETLTKQIKEKIWAEFQVIEGKGGIVAALKEGYPQEQIAAVLAARFKAAETRKDRIVGNNMYPNMTEERIDPRPESQAENMKARKAAIEAFLANVDAKDALAAVKVDDVDSVIAAAEKGATIAEIRKALGTAEVAEIKNISAHRWSERFEALREKTENFKARPVTMLKSSWRTWDPFLNTKPAQILLQVSCRSARSKFWAITVSRLLTRRLKRLKNPARTQLSFAPPTPPIPKLSPHSLLNFMKFCPMPRFILPAPPPLNSSKLISRRVLTIILTLGRIVIKLSKHFNRKRGWNNGTVQQSGLHADWSERRPGF